MMLTKDLSVVLQYTLAERCNDGIALFQHELLKVSLRLQQYGHIVVLANIIQ